MNHSSPLTCLAVFFLSTSVFADNDVFRFRGTSRKQFFGREVAGAGDVNRDGYDDIIVGSKDSATVYSGRDGSPLWTHAETDNFGRTVAGGADFNGDGHDEFLVGNGNGSFFVFSGATGDMLFSDNPGGDPSIHVSLAVVGDLDGDRVEDFVVGHPFNGDSSNPLVGRFVVYSGRDFTILHTEVGTVWEEKLGYEVAATGDLNGDLRADYAVSTQGKVDPYVLANVRVYSGVDHSVILQVTTIPGYGFGHAITGVEDFDGDEIRDLLVTAPWAAENGKVNSGSVFVISSANGSVLLSLDGQEADSYLGMSVCMLDDLNGDGLAEFLISCPGERGTIGPDPFFGTIYVHSGADATVLGQEYGTAVGSEFFGETAADLGDVNRDGVRDYGTTDKWHDGLFHDSGAAEVFSGRDYPSLAISYGTGHPGTNGIPDLGTTGPPKICEQMLIDIGNSLGATTPAILFIGMNKGNIPTGWGGQLLVQPTLVFPLTLPAAGLSLAVRVMCDTAFAGTSVYLQVLEADAGASDGVAFTPGLNAARQAATRLRLTARCILSAIAVEPSPRARRPMPTAQSCTASSPIPPSSEGTKAPRRPLSRRSSKFSSGKLPSLSCAAARSRKVSRCDSAASTKRRPASVRGSIGVLNQGSRHSVRGSRLDLDHQIGKGQSGDPDERLGNPHSGRLVALSEHIEALEESGDIGDVDGHPDQVRPAHAGTFEHRLQVVESQGGLASHVSSVLRVAVAIDGRLAGTGQKARGLLDDLCLVELELQRPVPRIDGGSLHGLSSSGSVD